MDQILRFYKNESVIFRNRKKQHSKRTLKVFEAQTLTASIFLASSKALMLILPKCHRQLSLNIFDRYIFILRALELYKIYYKLLN